MRKPLPPTLAWLLLVVSVPLGLLVPVVGPASWPVRFAGLLVAAGGLMLAQRSHGLFATTGAEIDTFTDPTSLIESGPYAYTRNPMYLGLAVFLAGAATAIGSLTAWIAPGAFFLACDRWYIPFEEESMSRVFGAAYDRYRARAPRWLGPNARPAHRADSR